MSVYYINCYNNLPINTIITINNIYSDVRQGLNQCCVQSKYEYSYIPIHIAK